MTPDPHTTSAGPDFTIEDFEDAIRALESNAITPPAVVAGPNVARLADALGAIATSWDVSGLDEPATPAMARQLVPTDGGGLREACAPVGSDAADDLDEVRRLLAAGDRGNAWLAGGDAIRNGARWSDDLSPPLDEPLDRAQVAALAGERPSLAVQTEPREAGWLRDLVEPAPPSEAERIAAHVAAVAPGYRERARAWLDAEHADMVEDLAALMATVSAECCS